MTVINWTIVVLQEGRFCGNLKSGPENNWGHDIEWGLFVSKCKKQWPVWGVSVQTKNPDILVTVNCHVLGLALAICIKGWCWLSLLWNTNTVSLLYSKCPSLKEKNTESINTRHEQKYCQFGSELSSLLVIMSLMVTFSRWLIKREGLKKPLKRQLWTKNKISYSDFLNFFFHLLKCCVDFSIIKLICLEWLNIFVKMDLRL